MCLLDGNNLLQMRDAVENLSQAYLDIRREGCIQFDDMLVIVHCSKKHKNGIEVKLQSISKSMIGHNGKKKALEHCEYLYTYLNNCVKKWRENMNKMRRYNIYLDSRCDT